MSREKKPRINLKVCSPKLKCRLLSPQPTRLGKRPCKRQKVDSNQAGYETFCSPEQERIFQTVQRKVMLAKLSRFGGFSSPRALLKMLMQKKTKESQLNCHQYVSTYSNNLHPDDSVLPRIKVRKNEGSSLLNERDDFHASSIKCKHFSHYFLSFLL
jgi:hypothetical protein